MHRRHGDLGRLAAQVVQRLIASEFPGDNLRGVPRLFHKMHKSRESKAVDARFFREAREDSIGHSADAKLDPRVSGMRSSTKSTMRRSRSLGVACDTPSGADDSTAR